MGDYPKRIWYRSSYKYQLAGDYIIQLAEIRPSTDISSTTNLIELTREGVLTVKKDYAWDGPSGPTIDTPDTMRGSLVHDALYQLCREGQLSPAEHRKMADQEFYRLCLEDGMHPIRAKVWYDALRVAGATNADPASTKAPICAPR